MTKIYQLKTRPNKEALGVETYLAPPPPLQGKIIGLDCHPDTFTAAVFVGQTPHEARKVGGRENLGLQALLGWAAKEFGPQDLFVLEAGSNSFELCTRLHALGLRAVVLESCHVGKHAKTYADNDKMAAARIALVFLAGNAPCVWVPDERSRQRRELLHAYGKAVEDHTAAGNSLRAYLNVNAIRPAKGNLELESTRQWILKQRNWSPLQSEILAEHFGDLDVCKERRKRLYRLIAAQMSAEPLMLRSMKVLGVGLINAFALLAVIGDVRRFQRPEKLVAYIGLNPGQRQSGRARTSNSAWVKEAVATSAIFSSKALRPFCAIAAPRPWANGAGNSSPEKATAMSPSPPSLANSWSSSGTCSRATRPPRWKPTKASLSNSTSWPWCWARLCAASSNLVTRCPLASRPFEAERFNLPIPHPENERIRTNRFDGGCAPPNPRTARRGRRSGGT